MEDFLFLTKKIFDYITDDENCILERKPLEDLAVDGELMLFKNEKFWQCVDTYRELEVMNSLWKNRKAPWKIWD